MNKFLVPVLTVVVLFSSCLQISNSIDQVALGQWRGLLLFDSDANIASDILIDNMKRDINLPFDLRSNGELPFIFNTVQNEAGQLNIEIINGDEVIVLDEVEFIPDPERERDSIVIHFPLYDTHIEALVERDVMEGYFIKDYLTDYKVPFKAYFARNFRFTSANKTPTADITGHWNTIFRSTVDSSFYPAVGEFLQNGNHLKGTFRTETGDYRFLEGTMQGDKIYLSTFDGTHAFLFEGKVFEDGNISGIFRSGPSYTESWEASKTDKEALRAADQMTQLTTKNPVEFSFPDENGKQISLKDPRFTGKPVILQVMGTWCPNCKDETDFLLDFKRNNPDKNFEILGLAFERYEDQDKSLKTIAKYRAKMEIPYPILLAGNSTSKSSASEALDFIDQIYSYPTMIFLDSDHKIVKIHTGFSGPATSKYEDFRSDFDRTITQLTQSK